jgi:hypothetical protein
MTQFIINHPYIVYTALVTLLGVVTVLTFIILAVGYMIFSDWKDVEEDRNWSEPGKR